MNTSIFNHSIGKVPVLTPNNQRKEKPSVRLNLIQWIGLFSLLFYFASCDLYQQDEYEPYVVVESYLVESNPFPPVRLSTTASANEFYNFQDQAIEDALVSIHLLRESDRIVEQSFEYRITQPGIYLPIDSETLVLPGRLYQLVVSVPGNTQLIQAVTRVPNTIEIIESIQDTVIYQSEEQIELTVSSVSDGQNQSVFVFNTLAKDTLAKNLTPFYLSLYEDDPIENSLTELSQTSSGTLNEGNFTRNPDGTITLTFPWIGVSFYENNQIVCNVIDQNLYDLLRSQSVQLGGSTLSPGEIQNAIYNIEGAIGIFGSLSSDTVQTYILPNPAFF